MDSLLLTGWEDRPTVVCGLLLTGWKACATVVCGLLLAGWKACATVVCGLLSTVHCSLSSFADVPQNYG